MAEDNGKVPPIFLLGRQLPRRRSAFFDKVTVYRLAYRHQILWLSFFMIAGIVFVPLLWLFQVSTVVFKVQLILELQANIHIPHHVHAGIPPHHFGRLQVCLGQDRQE